LGWVGLKKWRVGLVWVTKTGPTAMSAVYPRMVIRLRT